MSGWKPGSTAPTDGTMVLVLETPNGEAFNIVPAMFMNKEGGLGPRWWGVCGSRYSGEGGGIDLPVRFKALALTPIAWKPIDVSDRHKRALIRDFYPSYGDAIDAEEAAYNAARTAAEQEKGS